MGGFTTPSAGGITKLSELTIDADKAWADKGISQLKEIVSGMTAGDIVYHDGTRLLKLSPGVLGSQLITLGPTQAPKWGWVA